MSIQSDFIETMGHEIKKAVERYGFGYTSAILAQAALESGWGKSELAREHHNYFGMKCGSSWEGKRVTYVSGEYGGAYYKESDFRSYSSLSEGLKGYFEFLRYPRYSNLQSASSWEDYLDKIAADGWATNPTYAEKVKQIVRQYDLTRWDDAEVEPDETNVNYLDNPKDAIGKIATTKWAMKIREYPTTNAEQIGRAGEGVDYVISNVAKMLNGEVWTYSSELGGWIAWDVDNEVHLVVE